MATWNDTVPVERIRADAERVKPGRLLVTFIAGFFFLIGWVTGRTWLALVFCAIAVRYGWRQGTGSVPAPPQRPSARE